MSTIGNNVSSGNNISTYGQTDVNGETQVAANKSNVSKSLSNAHDVHTNSVSANYQGHTYSTLNTAGCIHNLQTLQGNMSVDIYAVMAIAQKTAQEMRDANREIRAASLDAQVSELLSAADDMQTAADFKLMAGIVQGGAQIASGLNQMNYGSKAYGSNDASAILAEGKGKSDTFSGMGTMLAAAINHVASSAEVSAKRHEATAKLHESAQAQANDMMQQMMDVIRDIRDKLGAIDQSRLETNRGIARNI